MPWIHTLLLGGGGDAPGVGQRTCDVQLPVLIPHGPRAHKRPKFTAKPVGGPERRERRDVDIHLTRGGTLKGSTF